MECKKINASLLLTMAVLAALWAVPAVHAQPWLVRGTVTDAATGQPLPAATVQLAGTYRGTIANDEGEYSLKVQQLPATLKVSYIGYVSQEQSVRGIGAARAPAERVDFALTPVPFLLDPIVVTAETSAEGIMRQVIRRKQAWRPSLASYQAQAYARRVLENEEGIVSIGELASEIYWERERGLREVVKSRRVTQNLDAQEEYISAFAGFANFYDDDIPFIGHTLIGPTHPDALKHYRFHLIGQHYLDDQVVFNISVEPKNKLQAAFVGRIAVLDEDFALLEVELAPSRATTTSAIPLPLIEYMDFAYQQQFRGFAGGVWLPVDFRASMAVKISMVGLHVPAIKYNVVTRLSDYQVNVDMPDTLYASEEVLRVDSLAVAQDSSFARLADKVPLSAREQAAYATIDSTMQPHHAFRPTGFLARLLVKDQAEQTEEETKKQTEPAQERAKSSRWLGSIELKPVLRYDRVGGAHLGLEGNRGLGGGLEARVGAGYNVGLERWSYRGRVGWQRTAGTAVLEYGRGPVPRIPSDSYPLLLNSGQFLLGLDDYFDYYWNERLRGRLHLSLPSQVGLAVGFNHEEHSSLQETSSFSLLNRDWRPRPNPAIEEGRLRSVEASLEWGRPYQPFGMTANRRVAVGVEHSSAGLGSDFSFTRLRLALDGHFKTFLRRRITPNALDVRVVAGYSIGDVPVQRFGALEASMGFFSPFGTFRTVRGHPYEGQHYAALYWEHNFKTTPFELLGLWDWAMRGAGLVVHGASGRTWIDPEQRAKLGYDPRYEASFHHEAGVSLMLYHLLRFDFTRRLDQPGWSVGLSLVRFDFEGAVTIE